MNSSQPSAPALCGILTCFFFIVTALIKVKSETKNSTLQWLTWYCTSGVFIIIEPVGVSFATRHAAGASSSPSRTPPTHCTNLPRVFHQMVEELGDLLFQCLKTSKTALEHIHEEKMVCFICQWFTWWFKILAIVNKRFLLEV